MMSEMTVDDAPAWEEPFVALYQERYDPMVRMAYLLTSDRAAAEELVQDAFVAVHRSWAQVTNPSAYLRRSVVNACSSWWRRKVLERDRAPRPEEPSALVADEMWDVLQTLPERQRAVVVLRFYEDLPDREIASLLGCREATVRTNVHRALAALRKEIEL